MYHDISARKHAEDELKALLLVDQLTGLPNRRAFITLSEQALKLATRMERDVLMIFIDVDHLKNINDTYGHLAGDRALMDTARVLRESCREADLIAPSWRRRICRTDDRRFRSDSGTRVRAHYGARRAHNREIDRGYELSLSLGAKRSKAEGNDAGGPSRPGGYRTLRAKAGTRPPSRALAIILRETPCNHVGEQNLCALDEGKRAPTSFTSPCANLTTPSPVSPPSFISATKVHTAACRSSLV